MRPVTSRKKKNLTRSAARKRGSFASLKVTDGFKSFVLDQLEALGDVTPRSMFGGVGLYRRGVFFGIIARDTLYLKVGASNLSDFKRAHAKPFKPYPNRTGSMNYYAVPIDVLESAQDLAEWSRKSLAVAEERGSSRRKR